jgi:hypothetical protein
VVRACVKAKVRFSFVLTKNPAVARAIASIDEDAGTPVHYPGDVVDPETGELISNAEVAETTCTAFGSTEHPVTARLIVCRVRDQTKLEELFPVWPRWRAEPSATSSTDAIGRRMCRYCREQEIGLVPVGGCHGTRVSLGWDTPITGVAQSGLHHHRATVAVKVHLSGCRQLSSGLWLGVRRIGAP